MQIRPERPEDHEAIAAITTAAFIDHPYSNQAEARLIDALRTDGALVLSLVAEDEDESGRREIVGHVGFSPVTIGGADLDWLALGPLSVAPARQNRGIGTQLVNAGLAEIHRRGAAGCVLVGDPAYYQRFGFRNEAGLVIPEIPPENVMALAFDGPVPQGTVEHHPAFALCA